MRPVIAANKEKFAGIPWMAFQVGDFTKDVLPRGDLIFCRDALQHLALPLIFAALERFAVSLSGDPHRYLLVGSYDTGNNRNISTGDYFSIDLRAEPFNLQPLEVFPELHENGHRPKALLLYTGQQLAAADIGAIRKRAHAAGMR